MQLVEIISMVSQLKLQLVSPEVRALKPNRTPRKFSKLSFGYQQINRSFNPQFNLEVCFHFEENNLIGSRNLNKASDFLFR